MNEARSIESVSAGIVVIKPSLINSLASTAVSELARTSDSKPFSGYFLDKILFISSSASLELVFAAVTKSGLAAAKSCGRLNKNFMPAAVLVPGEI